MSYPNARLCDRTTPPHLLTLVLLAGIPALNMSVFLPALPEMTADLNTEYAIMQLSISLYLFCTAILQLLVGPLSDRYGRRPVILWAMLIFALASLGCYMATTAEIFLIFRMISAAVAVGVVLSRAIIRDIVPMAQAASVIGYVTMGMSLVPMLAPTFGGHIDEYFGWRAIFLFNVIVGLGLVGFCWLDQGETNLTKSTSFKAQFADYPELFASPRFWGYAMTTALSSGVFFAFLGGTPYVASVVYNMEPTITRYLFGIPGLGYLFGNMFSGRYSTKIGVDRMILLGNSLLVLGMGASLLCTFIGYGSALMFFGFSAFIGLGNGIALPSANAGLLSVRPHLAGSASGVGGAIMIGGGAVLAALSGAVLEYSHSSYPLQLIMLASALLSLGAILFVHNRNAKRAEQ